MSPSLILVFQLVLAAPLIDHAYGEDGPMAFQWAGIFDTPENTYLWTAQKTKSGNSVKYADATMKMAVLPIVPPFKSTKAVLHQLRKQGNHSLTTICTDVLASATIEPLGDKCYNLKFKEDWWQSLFTVNTTGHAAVAFFTEHFPTQFENTAHYLKDDRGVDIEPNAELPEKAQELATGANDGGEDDYWGPVIGSAIMVNIVTLSGVVLLVPGISKLGKSYTIEFESLAAAFAAGAISSCAFFLLLFESTHLIAEGQAEEVETLWRWGALILAGMLFPVVVHNVIELTMNMKTKVNRKGNPDAENKDPAGEMTPLPSKARIMSGILIGDFFHNLCDGFFVAAAFKGCGTTFGWTVAWSTIVHELAQELADYIVLTGKDCNLRPSVALGLNFLSGTSVLLGSIIILATDVSQGDIGLLLAFGGGVYLYIALVECMPKLHAAQLSGKVRALGILLFILGAVAIGLVLIKHEHCVPPVTSGAEPTSGHGHGHR